MQNNIQQIFGCLKTKNCLSLYQNIEKITQLTFQKKSPKQLINFYDICLGNCRGIKIKETKTNMLVSVFVKILKLFQIPYL